MIGNIILGGTLRYQARILPEGCRGARISTTVILQKPTFSLPAGVGFLFVSGYCSTVVSVSVRAVTLQQRQQLVLAPVAHIRQQRAAPRRMSARRADPALPVHVLADAADQARVKHQLAMCVPLPCE